jgi:hypothetical protein
MHVSSLCKAKQNTSWAKRFSRRRLATPFTTSDGAPKKRPCIGTYP